MKYRKLGRTDIEVSVICCGTMAMASGGTFGAQDDELSVRTIHSALDAGVSFFDTAEGYGAGHSELVLGRALRDRRQQVVIATKVSSAHLRRRGLLQACDESLFRLRTDYIDLYQIHWRSRKVPIAETAAVLERLRETGKIRCWGVSNFGTEDMNEASWEGRPEVNQLPYSLLWRVIEHDIAPLCVRHDVSIICYSPLAQGILTGKFAGPDDVPAQRKRARYCRDQVIGHSFGVVDELRAVSEEIGEPMADIALAWLLGRPGVSSVIAGMRTPEQAQENARAAELSLPQGITTRLEQASQPLMDALDANPDMWQEGAESRYN